MRGDSRHQQQVFESLLKTHGKPIADAFREAVRGGAQTVAIKDLAAAIDRQDIDRILVLLKIEPERMFAVTEALRSAFVGGGLAVEGLVPVAAEFAFDGAHPLAERWILDYSAELVTRITEEARDTIREVVREGLAEARGSARTARELVGRGKAREGARIGLTAFQNTAVRNTRRDLETLDANYFGRAWRDRRYDSQVLKAMNSGRPLSRSQIDTIVGRYAERAERHRALSIAQVEARRGIASGQDVAYRQLLARPNVEEITKRWQWNRGGQQEPRGDHQAMSGTILPLEQPFIFPDGARLQYPNDPNGPVEHTIWCRCTTFRRVKMRTG